MEANRVTRRGYTLEWGPDGKPARLVWGPLPDPAGELKPWVDCGCGWRGWLEEFKTLVPGYWKCPHCSQVRTGQLEARLRHRKEGSYAPTD